MGVLTEDKESSPSHGASTCAAKKKIPLPSVGKVTGLKRGAAPRVKGTREAKSSQGSPSLLVALILEK